MDKVDATMATVNEQRELANEVAEAISNPMYGNTDVDEVSTLPLFHIFPCRECFFLKNRINYGKSWRNWNRSS
jgi:hypothetical protein